METLALIAAMAAVLVLLHVAVAAYLYRVAPPGERLEALGDAEPETRRDGPGDAVGAAEEAMPCPACGASNDPSYRFCRRCVADLTGGKSAANGAAAGRLGS